MLHETPAPLREDALLLRLSSLPEAWLQINCDGCSKRVGYPFKLAAQEHGNMTLAEMIAGLKCSGCRKPPSSVTLEESVHRDAHGHCTGWTVKLT